MSRIIDARGLACPHPVILTKKALDEDLDVTTIVDSETARENIVRLAKSHGYELSVEDREDGIYLHLLKKETEPEKPAVSPVPKTTVLLIASDNMGRGSEELGNILMQGFMHTLSEATPRLNKIIFINSGVKLVVKGSEVIDDLHDLAGKGVEILSCGTCLDYYNLKKDLQVGLISNMYDITTNLLQADKVVTV